MPDKKIYLIEELKHSQPDKGVHSYTSDSYLAELTDDEAQSIRNEELPPEFERVVNVIPVYTFDKLRAELVGTKLKESLGREVNSKSAMRRLNVMEGRDMEDGIDGN